jgi:hypothetical protein
MKKVGYVAVAALLGMGLIRSAQAHVFVGVNVGMPVMPVAPVVVGPVAHVAVYAPPPVYAPPVAVGYWGGWGGHRGWGYRRYAAGYWR